MTSLILACLLSPQSVASITRTDYGVPVVRAANRREAFYQAGYAVAQDRLWQMEMARRLAGGRLSEVLGASSVASDRSAARTMYTDAELKKMLAARSEAMRSIWQAYAEGVNAWIAEAKRKNELPKGYAANGFEPAPWTPLDSAKIATMMGRQFGGGGGLEITLWAALQYLQSQPGKARALDIMDDMAPLNDRRSPTTVEPADEAPCGRLEFGTFDRKDTERQLAALPKTSLFELMPAARLSAMEDFREQADRLAVAAKWGSYAVLVGKERSATGWPLLLGAPQMGFSVPSVVHEITFDCPGLKVTGLNVPGIPGVIIGNSPDAAWTLTTAAADTQDIFVQALDEQGNAMYDGKSEPLEQIEIEIPVKGGQPVKELQRRTRFGPVVLLSKGSKAVYSLRSSFYGREIESYEAMIGLAGAKTSAEFRSAAEKMTLGFNLFYATKRGEIGWNYCGLMPRRASGLDPRLPTPATPENDWKGVQPMASALHVVNPKGGLITNWNNKPISWFPNLDTPYWFAYQHVANLRASLPAGKLTLRDVEQAAWQIARREDASGTILLPLFRASLAQAKLSGLEAEASRELAAWDGWAVDGSRGMWLYRAMLTALREELIQPATGNFLSPDTFAVVAHPSLLRDALEKKTRYPFLGSRTAGEVVVAAFRKAVSRIPDGNLATALYRAPWFVIPSGQVAYSNRGTFIQVVELGPSVFGRSANPPGVAESGPHSNDQTPLAHEWRYKPMMPWGNR